MSDLVVQSKTQTLKVNPASRSVSITNAGPVGPAVGSTAIDDGVTATGTTWSSQKISDEIAAATPTITVPFERWVTFAADSVQGALSIKLRMFRPGTLLGYYVHPVVAPATGDFVVDCLKASSFNGTYSTVMTTTSNRATVTTADGDALSGTPDTQAFVAGDYFRFELTTIDPADVGNLGNIAVGLLWEESV